MIRVSDESALEKLLRGIRFTNENHKQQLMRRLQKETGAGDELSEDELAMATGGTRPPESDFPSQHRT